MEQARREPGRAFRAWRHAFRVRCGPTAPLLPRPWPLLVLLAAAPAFAQDAGAAPELAQYIERREVCEHFREEPWPEGEDAEARERRDFIAAQREQYCSGADQGLRELKARHAGDPQALGRLERYEAEIEVLP